MDIISTVATISDAANGNFYRWANNEYSPFWFAEWRIFAKPNNFGGRDLTRKTWKECKGETAIILGSRLIAYPCHLVFFHGVFVVCVLVPKWKLRCGNTLKFLMEIKQRRNVCVAVMFISVNWNKTRKHFCFCNKKQVTC